MKILQNEVSRLIIETVDGAFIHTTDKSNMYEAIRYALKDFGEYRKGSVYIEHDMKLFFKDIGLEYTVANVQEWTPLLKNLTVVNSDVMANALSVYTGGKWKYHIIEGDLKNNFIVTFYDSSKNSQNEAATLTRMYLANIREFYVVDKDITIYLNGEHIMKNGDYVPALAKQLGVEPEEIELELIEQWRYVPVYKDAERSL